MFFEKEIKYNKKEILNLHINAYFGEKENVKKVINNQIIIDFKETLCYCLGVGCKRNIDFAKYCNENFKFKNEEYKNSIAISFIINGEWEKNLFYDTNEIITELYIIKTENLKKLIKVYELKDILAYLCILKKEEKLFKEIKNPKMLWQTNILIKNLNLPNYFENDVKYIEEESFSWIPIKIKEYDQKDFNIDIFENKLSFDNIKRINYDNYSNNLLDLTNIKNIEKYILFNKDIYKEKINNKEEIINDVRICKYSKNKNIYINEHCSKISAIDEELLEDIILNIKPFLIYINIPYSLNVLKIADEKYKWLIIYTNILSNKIINKNILENEEFVEYNCLKAAYMLCRKVNIKRLKELLNKTKKCYKLLDTDNNKFIKEEIDINNINLEKKFDVNYYKYQYF